MKWGDFEPILNVSMIGNGQKEYRFVCRQGVNRNSQPEFFEMPEMVSIAK